MLDRKLQTRILNALVTIEQDNSKDVVDERQFPDEAPRKVWANIEYLAEQDLLEATRKTSEGNICALALTSSGRVYLERLRQPLNRTLLGYLAPRVDNLIWMLIGALITLSITRSFGP